MPRQVAASSIERKKASFTDQAFADAWHAYIEASPGQKILISAMRAAKPVRLNDMEFRVLVDHPAQQQAFESAMPKLLAFLRERLGNDFLSLRVEINPDKEIAKYLSPQEFLQKTIDTNPRLGQFLKQLDIEL